MTNAACTVRSGHVLLENTYANTVNYGVGGGPDVSYPQSELRLGTSNSHLEYDFNFPSYGRSSAGGSTQQGATDLGFGATYEIGYGPRWLYGADVVVTLPTGSATLTAGKAQWTGSFNWAYFTTRWSALAGTFGVNSLAESNALGVARSYFAATPSIGATARLARGIGIGCQDAYVSADGPGLPSRNTMSAFVVRVVNPRVLAYAQYGLSPAPLGGMEQRSFTLGAWVMR